MVAMNGGQLPVTVAVGRGESIDSWLERVADANGLTTATLLNLVHGAGEVSTRFLSLAPAERTVARVACLTGSTVAEVRSATVAAFEDAGVDLRGLSAEDRDSFHEVAARGWPPSHGTQLCSRCLRDDGRWQVRWRLPIVSVCARHEAFLVGTCPVCGRIFRDHRHSALRPVGASATCGNPIGAGPARQCTHDLAGLPAVHAEPGCIAMQRRVDAALDTKFVLVWGEAVPGADYLADLRHLTCLLLHLACQPGAQRVAQWADDLQIEAAARTALRGPRWGMHPPDDCALRGRVLTGADHLLDAADRPAAADEMAAWITLVPSTTDGILGWLADRTVMTPRLTSLVLAALAPHRRLSHRLDHPDGAPMRLVARAIPQVIPHDVHVEHLADAFDCTEPTVRAFASLCLARMDPDVRSWAAAAEALEIPPAMGTRTARACSARMIADHDEWTSRLQGVMRDLPRVDYRALEEKVRHRTTMFRWFDEWARRVRPGSQREAQTYALIWQWEHIAHGHIDLAPAWRERPPVAKDRALYRQFEASLSDDQQSELRYALYKRA